MYFQHVYSISICENSRYLKNIFDDSVNVCNKIINVTDSVSRNGPNTVSTNVKNAVNKF